MQPQSAFASTALYQTPVIEGQPGSRFTWPWVQQFLQAAAELRAPAAGQVPASSSAPGQLGQIATDGTYLYVATGTNQWKRIALSSF